MNSVIVSDAAERQAALDPNGSFIVQAPAGSGKTGLLIQRILILLARVQRPEEILAITFTRKAAAEMLARVLDALDRAADDTPPDDPYEQQLWSLARDALARDRELGWNLKLSPARLHFQTIDALCLTLSRQMPLVSGLGGQSSIAEDAAKLYREAAAETIAHLQVGDAWSADLKVLLDHLDNNIPRVQRLLAEMLATRDRWHRLMREPKYRDGLERGVSEEIDVSLVAFSDLLSLPMRAELGPILMYVVANLPAESELHSKLEWFEACNELPPVNHEHVEVWRGIAELMTTGSNTIAKAPNTKKGFPAPSEKGISKEDKEFRKKFKDKFSAILTDLSENAKALPALLVLRSLPAQRYTDQQWRVLEALFGLLKLSSAKLELVFEQYGQVDFSRVSLAAAHALGEDADPTDLALIFDYRLQHILIDEFQDTSIMQYELLEALTRGWEPQDGRTLFLVGDPMQSIYRFRQAEVELFQHCWNGAFQNVMLTPLRLSVNFRSDPVIVDWVNQCFDKLLPAKANPDRGYVAYEHGSAARSAADHTLVETHSLIDQDSSQEAQRVIDIVRRTQQQNSEQSIAVLVRNRSHVRDIIAAFRAENILYQAVDIESLSDQPAISDLLALLCALQGLQDRIAWLSILRAPWCGLTLTDMTLLCGDNLKQSVWDCTQVRARVARLSENGQVRLQRIITALAPLLASARGQQPVVLLERAWLRLGGPAFLGNSGELDDVRSFFDLVARMSDSPDGLDIDELKVQLSRRYSVQGDIDEHAVKLMTIHKSKGLEFDTVILPGLHRGTRLSNDRLLEWVERPDNQNSSCFLIAPIRDPWDEKDSLYSFIQNIDADIGEHELVRLLYVATTRAKSRLHLLACPKRSYSDENELRAPNRKSLLGRLWPALELDFRQGELLDEVETESELLVLSRKLRRVDTSWVVPGGFEDVNTAKGLADSVAIDSVEFDWASESTRLAGIVVHRILQAVTEGSLVLPDLALERRAQKMLFDVGIPEGHIEGTVARVVRAVENTLADEQGQWVMAHHEDERNEYALSAMLDSGQANVIIDRTFIDQGVRWIVDYKTGEHTGTDVEAFLDAEQSRYASQLHRYARVLSQIDSRPIKLGLYFPLMKAWREWSFQEST